MEDHNKTDARGDQASGGNMNQDDVNKRLNDLFAGFEELRINFALMSDFLKNMKPDRDGSNNVPPTSEAAASSGARPKVPPPGATNHQANMETQDIGVQPPMEDPRFALIEKIPNEVSRFDPEKVVWDQYIENFHLKLNVKGINYGELRYGQILKNVIYMCLGDKAQAQARPLLNPTRTDVQGLTYEAYINSLNQLFNNPESELQSLRRYEKRTQGPNEPVISYLNEKYALYLAGPGRNTGDFNKFRVDAILGLYNEYISAKCWDEVTYNLVDLKNQIVRLINIEELKRSRNRSDAGRAGLVIGGMERENRGGQVHAVEEEVHALNVPNRTRRCWDCGSLKHFQNSPKCPSPGAGKFRPKFVKRDSEGERPRSLSRPGRGRRLDKTTSQRYRRGAVQQGEYRRGFVNQVEIEEDEEDYYDDEDHEVYYSEDEDGGEDEDQDVPDQVHHHFLEYRCPPQKPK